MAKQTLEKFYQNLNSGELAVVYLLFGDDTQAVEAAAAAVEARVVAAGVSEFNSDHFHARGADVGQIVATARTLPMLAERRLVAVRRVEEFKAPARERLLEYLASPSPATILLLSAGPLSLRGNAGRKDEALLKAADKAGVVVEFPRPKPAQLPHLVEDMVRARGKGITSEAVSLLLDLTSSETLGLSQEVEKVCLYVGDKERISKDDVLAAAADIKEASVFEFTDAIGSRDVKTALRALRRMREQGQELLMILGMLLRHFRILWQVQERREAGESAPAIASQLKLNEWVLKKNYFPQAAKFPSADMGRVMRLLADLDIKLKSTRADRELLFERAVIALCLGRSF
jgi:DNA polymerase-3 subunit delta